MLSELTNPAIVVESVSKRYQLGAASFSLNRSVRDYWQKFRGQATNSDAVLWALCNVSFKVNPGEVLGIIGSNGAGKTTMLRLLARVTKPSEGSVSINGKVSALIELGAGFHPELTGRENVYLNGAILGMKRRQIDQVLDQIIEFSELAPFMDTPVKRYSSGMYARLGFSVAVCVDPDILLVDEVLSVGDIAFQQKSLQRMLEFRAQAKAMIFISHNLTAVQQLCSTVIWLDHGQVVMQARPDEVIEQYRRASAQHSLRGIRAKQTTARDNATVTAKITRVELLDSARQVQSTFRVGDGLVIRLSVSIHQPLSQLVCAVALYRHDGLKLGETNNVVDGFSFGRAEGEGQVVLELPQLSLAPGTYYMNVAISENSLVMCDHITCAAQFEIQGTEAQSRVPGPLYVEGNWKYFPQTETEYEGELTQRSYGFNETV